MTARERILTVRLIYKINRNPKQGKALGIEVTQVAPPGHGSLSDKKEA